MQLIPGAPNSFMLKQIKRNDDGNIELVVKLDNQEQGFNLSEVVTPEEYGLIEGKIKEAFGIFLPGLINKLMSQ